MPAKLCKFLSYSVLSISWQDLNHPNLLVQDVTDSCVFSGMNNTASLWISLPCEDGLSMIKNSYIKRLYYICDDCSVNADETWMYEDSLCSIKYGVFGDARKATETQPYAMDNYPTLMFHKKRYWKDK